MAASDGRRRPGAREQPAPPADRRARHDRHRGLRQDRAHLRGRGLMARSVPGRTRAGWRPRPGRGLRGCRAPRAQRGVALLVAILLVALGTILAAAIAYEN